MPKNDLSSATQSAGAGAVPIVPCLWFDDRAEDAASFYTSLFPDSAVLATTPYARAGQEIHGRAPGSTMTVEFQLAGRTFVGLNGGPHFRFNPAVSLFVTCDTVREVDALWAALGAGGQPLMDLGRYDWSERYGWTTDRFGLSWQIFLGRVDHKRARIAPCFLFVGQHFGLAEAAVRRWTSIFPQSRIDTMLYQQPDGPGGTGAIKHTSFSLGGHGFTAMESEMQHDFGFSGAVSFQVLCATQTEIDRYWNALGEGGDPATRQCGWLQDRFGVFWQVVPEMLAPMLRDADADKAERAMTALLKMKKLDIAALRAAASGEGP